MSDMHHVVTDPEALAEFNARLQQDGVVRDFQARTRLHDGKTKWFSLYATLERPHMLVNGFALDITEQKRAEEALKASEENYRGIIDRAMEGFYQVSPQGRSLLANPTMVKMLGYESSEQMGQELTDMGRQLWVRQEERERYARILNEHGEVRGFETELRRRDGRRIWVSLNARNVRDAQGQPQYFEGFILDITERKLAEDALRASEANYRSSSSRSKHNATCQHCRFSLDNGFWIVPPAGSLYDPEDFRLGQQRLLERRARVHAVRR